MNSPLFIQGDATERTPMGDTKGNNEEDFSTTAMTFIRPAGHEGEGLQSGNTNPHKCLYFVFLFF